MPSRKQFLTVAAVIALSVGAVAVLAPSVLLEGKGVARSAAAMVWMREVGVAIFATGVTTFLLRSDRDSPTMRAFLIGSAVLQVGIFPIEIVAYGAGIITKASGIVPNEILHVVLACGFAYYASRVDVSPAARAD